MIIQPIASSFILSKASVSLPEMAWSFRNGIIGARTVVDLASALIEDGNETEELVGLASICRQDLADVSEHMASVVLDSEQVERVRRKWVWLLLYWVHENREHDADVFQTVEAIYADLGYPEEMEPFGPYAPAYQGRRDSAEVQDDVMAEWRRYLKRGEEEFGRS